MICFHVIICFGTFCLQFCWVLGTMFEAVLALLVMTNIHKHGWNWLLGLSAVPIIISTFVVPVSACSVVCECECVCVLPCKALTVHVSLGRRVQAIF